ncbi:protein JTB-like isoform X3 [Neopsephotus bourkii]|uniref:protein JTB-like isoform X3 n=1 Tax=Neopsephotus bourkii TaxID=309878 RepID=UPI002AA533F1|nr:protein JTB-like isoform X3 [Neopsephotus bourkii]XP_061220302.1 protein JTB-like isoform X3 [Neopsephotus bourkii]
MAAGDERRSASPVAATACWRVEEFVVAQECGPCSAFQMTVPECSPTGFVERINCAGSKRAEYKSSCRSARVDARSFWRFVGSMLGLAALSGLLVLSRQRLLDRRALEKVRKQLEAI